MAAVVVDAFAMMAAAVVVGVMSRGVVAARGTAVIVVGVVARCVVGPTSGGEGAATVVVGVVTDRVRVVAGGIVGTTATVLGGDVTGRVVGAVATMPATTDILGVLGRRIVDAMMAEM